MAHDFANGLTRSEEEVRRVLSADGHTVLRNGWPDFLVISRKPVIMRGVRLIEKGVLGLEVKSGSDRLSPEQEATHNALCAAGVSVATVWEDNPGKLIARHSAGPVVDALAFQYLDTEAAGRMLSISPATLTTWRVRGGGPPFRKVGGDGRLVRYALADLVAFAEGRPTQKSTSEAA